MTKTNFEIENYKDIKNYIHNYLGLTKEEVNEKLTEALGHTPFQVFVGALIGVLVGAII